MPFVYARDRGRSGRAVGVRKSVNVESWQHSKIESERCIKQTCFTGEPHVTSEEVGRSLEIEYLAENVSLSSFTISNTFSIGSRNLSSPLSLFPSPGECSQTLLFHTLRIGVMFCHANVSFSFNFFHYVVPSVLRTAIRAYDASGTR